MLSLCVRCSAEHRGGILVPAGASVSLPRPCARGWSLGKPSDILDPEGYSSVRVLEDFAAQAVASQHGPLVSRARQRGVDELSLRAAT